MPYQQEKIVLDEGPALRKVFVLSLPIIISYLLQVAYDLTDAGWLGMLGKEQVAAMAFVFPVIFVAISIGIGIGMAGSIFVAQYEGARDHQKVNYAAAQTFTFTLIASVVVSVFGFIIAPYLVGLLGATHEVAPLAISYLKITFAGIILMFAFFIFGSLMRGWGNTRTPMKIMLFSTGLNIVLDPFLIFGIWIFPPLGIRGAALATVFSRGVASLIGMYILFKGKFSLKIKLTDLKPDLGMLKKMIALGLPATLEHANRALAFLVLTAIVAGFGTVQVAAYGIGLRVFSIVIMPSLAVAMGVAASVGQNLGAAKPQRAAKVARDSGIAMFAIIAGLAAVMYFNSSTLAKVFIKSKEIAVIIAASGFIRRLALSAAFVGAAITLEGAIKGAGRTTQSMIIGVSNLWGVRIPVAYFLSRHLGSAAGVWDAFVIGAILELIVVAVYFKLGKWKSAIIK